MTKGSAPLRINNARELAPGFRPKWVQLRARLFMVSAAMAIAFVIAAVMQWQALVLLFLFGVWGLMSVAVPMAHLPAMLRLACKSFPGFTARAEAWIDRMEYDLDWDEQRR